MREVLVKMLSDRVVRMGEHSWQWANKDPGNPSLRNAITSSLFRADLVEEVDGELKLTAAGRLSAERLKNENN
jgi:hypothetical protein